MESFVKKQTTKQKKGFQKKAFFKTKEEPPSFVKELGDR
jgi:hypothetical protein